MSARGTALALVLGVLAASSLCGHAIAQGPAASASAAASAPKPSGSASASPSARPAESGSLPPGHPPVDEGLPEGHPPVGDEGAGQGPVNPQENPHNPHGGGPPSDPRFFNPPADTSQDDPTLPPGVIVAVLRNAKGEPLPRTPITLGILRNTVAKGEARERVAKETDDKGEVRFENLSTGSGVTYRVSTTRDSATYAVLPFALSDKAGKRAVLHSYEVSRDVDKLMVGVQGMVYFSLKEDSIQIEHLYTIFNLGPVSWVPDVQFMLPPGFKAFNKPDSMGDARIDEVPGKGAALRGTFPPGRHEVSFRFQVPLAGKDRQSVVIAMPPRVAQFRVMAEASKDMGLMVQDFPASQRASNRDGKRILVTERQATRADGGLAQVSVTLTGLPTPGPGRWIAIGLALLAVVAGLTYYLVLEDDAIDEDTRDDLIEAREALLDEIVSLEKLHKKGDVGPKTYARVRAALLDALARVVEKLESANAAAKKRKRAARAV